MTLRELLSSSQREAIDAIPVDRAGLIEHYVLNEADLNLIRQPREPQPFRFCRPVSALAVSRACFEAAG